MLSRLFIGLLLLLPGCASSAHPLFGTSNPAIVVQKNLLGTKVVVGTDFEGRAKGSYNQETKEFAFDVEVISSPTAVIAAEAERIDHMERIREMEFQMLLEQTRAMTGMVTGVVDALNKMVTTVGKTITEVVP